MFKLAFGVGLTILGAWSAEGATFTAFNVHTNLGTLPSTPISFTFGGSSADVSGSTISCPYSGGCSGTAFAFTFSAAGYDPTQILSATLGGTLSGTTAASGTVSLSGNFNYQSFAFSIAPGTSESNVFRVSIPLTGLVNDISFFSLNLAPYQSLTFTDGLGLSFATPTVPAQPSSIPEPGSVALLGLGLAGLTYKRLR